MDVVFNDRLGNPVEPWVQYTLDEFFSTRRMGPAERQLYNELIHESEHCFENYNKYICSDCRLAGKERYASKDRGCCTDCANCKGYVASDCDSVFESMRNKAIKHLWTDRYGYFDIEKHCCKVPRHLRSRTCLGFSCENDNQDFYCGVRDLTETICYLRKCRFESMFDSYLTFYKRMHKQLYTG